MKQDNWKNQLILGDNKEVMQELLPALAGQINLIYIDPPFNTGKNRATYSDRWNSINDYLSFLRDRLQLMKQLLADTGSIYVHLDWHACHYVKVMMDEIFGYKNFRNEIIWNKGFRGTESKGGYQHTHDVIIWYSKGSNYIWNAVRQPYRDTALKRYNKKDEEGKRYALIKRKRTDGKVYYGRTYPKEAGKRIDDVISHIAVMAATSGERLGFDTQKPEELLKVFVLASSNPDDIVADFFCGSGTTLAVAEKLGRRWVGCDVSEKAIEVSRNRLEKISAHPFLTIIKTKEKN